MVDASSTKDCFIKIAILIRTGRVWTSEASFVEGLSLFLPPLKELILLFVNHTSTVVATLKELLRYFTKRGTKDFTLES